MYSYIIGTLKTPKEVFATALGVERNKFRSREWLREDLQLIIIRW